jgi:hypothetical protein
MYQNPAFKKDGGLRLIWMEILRAKKKAQISLRLFALLTN